ncbi:MAG: FAD-dependent oxidoreductase [Xanthomonadales bacterium]|nr:FAD-dependent oxidoreductase [Gammaproteobacteria bacterium]MBT8053104.1 FAD-dependent oxidoreductase [Gammaproteobacteria bacterium]NND56244.1 FAD-dependent oxidoreductase [Xanthomonadales bacterium]NNK52319.1 FAD-dependent oxidoreductase [Xanthomonadales bacterium]
MKKSDRQLGMDRDITRRDFIHDLSLASLGLAMPMGAMAGANGGEPQPAGADYPPVRTGMRGSHPGAFETAHALARNGKKFSDLVDLEETYDLVVVGAGISGLAAAYYYRKQFGADSRILILENHDDFGGHARRNEFHQGGQMRLSWGGTMNLEFPMFSDTANALLDELGVDIDELLEGYEFEYGSGPKGSPSVYFDAETYGRSELVHGFSFREGGGGDVGSMIGRFPISADSRESLASFYTRRENVFEGKSAAEVKEILSGISYTGFLKQYGGLTDEAADLFIKTTHGYWGLGADSLSARECINAGLPIMHLLGYPYLSGSGDDDAGGEVAMFPDGNASIARLLVHALIPDVSPGSNARNIALARFDYSRLDQAASPVRLRLESTVVNVQNNGPGTRVTYANHGQLVRVESRHTVLACYHRIIPYLCPDMPREQKEAQQYQVKRPLILTNVLLRDSKAFDRLDISGTYCPGRLHGAVWQVKGVNTAGYRHDWEDAGPVPVMFWGSVAPPDSRVPPKEQHRASRARLLAMSFEDFEREVRTVLDGMLGPAGFDVQQDILAITVNRWPHGYAYDYLDLWDPDWPPGQAPHEIARRPLGNITIANADAGADAYTHIAIDQAWRAVTDLPAGQIPS